MIETIFYILFLSQILLFSVYFPNKIYQRMRYVITHYPCNQYPKLYPQPIENYHRFHGNYRLANWLIAAAGLVILTLSIVFNNKGEFIEPQVLVWLFFMVQFMPVMVIELSEFSQFKMMRTVDRSSVRSATLSPRNLASFIYWNLYGKKLNPHQTEADRQQVITVAIKSLVFISISASIFLMVTLSIKEYQLHSLAPLAMTIYLQVIALFSLGNSIGSIKVDELNFDLYKKGSLL